ncbi:MAG: RdgB/HAM1 family non-canonical purine NTP pyrophosphatase [Candidatus Competibacterales bacterium]|nr:RdgB/HAM1 family non-canonical purine NTP pyrophosphatase [Candidatus Competibacterales bacterium]
MPELVLATGNPGKLRELAALLAPLEIEVVAQSALGVPEVEETGLSFVENALLKARNAARHTGLAALADDSGLCVDALDGAPGVRSARFAGPGADDAANRARLRAALEGVEPARRGARFVCVLTLLRHAEDPLPLICQGLWEGVIARSERGDHGFGYDPLFELPGRDMTAAQLPPEEKNRLSHRGRALAGLREALGTRPL